MRMRIGKVTQVFPSTGKMKVLYEDENNASLQLSMLTMNNEYSMPKVGDRVLTMHMENGSSKGFVLGTYYGGGTQPKANSGYRKDYGGGAYATVKSGGYKLSAGSIELVVGDSDALQSIVINDEGITFKCPYGEETFENILKRLERIEDLLGLPHTIPS
ncbi:MAG: hypothetical protein IJL07_10520 [Lachnospiraceae bacterium]|nr:hypothetical protein [Lachnospiraceae bacterium]